MKYKRIDQEKYWVVRKDDISILAVFLWLFLIPFIFLIAFNGVGDMVVFLIYGVVLINIYDYALKQTLYRKYGLKTDNKGKKKR
jgi:hypothetical protein